MTKESDQIIADAKAYAQKQGIAVYSGELLNIIQHWLHELKEDGNSRAQKKHYIRAVHDLERARRKL